MTYNRPGVYITERLLPSPIGETAAANAAGAVIGYFSQGPSEVTLVTSWYDFTKQFGSYSNAYPATFGVGQFFANGGTELYVRRVLGTGADVAGAEPDFGTIAAKNSGTDGNNLFIQLVATGVSHYFNVEVYKTQGLSDVLVEVFNNVVFNDRTSNDFVENVANPISKYIVLTVDPAFATDPSTAAVIPLSGGVDGAAPTTVQVTGALADFEGITRPLVFFAPEVYTIGVSTDGQVINSAILDWAAGHNGFAVFDLPAGTTPSSAIVDAGYIVADSTIANSGHGAVYYPSYYIQDPVARSSSALRLVGPAGAMAGLYLATDRAVGPFKAAAGINARLNGALALEIALTSQNLDDLNSATTAVNSISNLPGVGIVAMGARTLLNDGTSNKYISMRRSLIHITKELEDLTQFALFENNDSSLWSRINTTITVFLNDYRNKGGLAGSSPDQSFFIKVDEENNTADSIARGEVNIQVGVALQYPAEFVVITLSQKTAI